MTPEEIDLLRKQNAMLLRTLVRVKGERDALAKKLAVLANEQSESPAR